MRFISYLFFLIANLRVGAQMPSPDSLVIFLYKNGTEQFISVYATPVEEFTKTSGTPSYEHNRQILLLAIAYDAAADSVRARAIHSWILDQNTSTVQREAILSYLFKIAGDFITQRPVYVAIHHLGIMLAREWNEPRAQFAFLENLMGLELFTKDEARKTILLRQMKQLSQGHPYLELRTAFHYGEYYRALHHDSCAYYFQVFIEGIKPLLGVKNPYFLQDGDWIMKADSALLASTYRGYATFSIKKGELKKGGELLVLADQVIPDAPTYALRRVENQISLSSLYADLVNKEKAIEYAEKAIALCAANDYPKMRNGRVAAAYARALFINEKFGEAAKEYETAYTYYLGGLNKIDPKRQALNLAINAVYAKDPEGARAWKNISEAIICDPDDEILYLTATIGGLFGLYGENISTSLSLLREAQQLAEKSNNARWMRESQYHLYLVNKEKGRLLESLSHYENYVEINDSLYRSGQEVALSEIDGKYRKSIQDEQIATLNARNAVHTARIQEQKRIVLAGGIALVILMIFVAALYFLYKKVKSSHAIILRSNEEKSILLKEIHHRVKNNLQVISSLLKLQSGYIKDEAAIQAIAEGRSRVQSMALLHQNLYREDNLTGVNMNAYFDNLIQGLFDTYNISADRVKLHKNIAPITLDVDTVVPLGLIMNELISNALKHAFTGTTSGNLFVELLEVSEKLILKVKDDGHGIPPNSVDTGFGSKLIQSLSQKLEAELTITSVNGTEVVLSIGDYKKAA